MSRYTLGLDIGGTRLKGGVIDQNGSVVDRLIHPTLPHQSPSEFEKQLHSLVTSLQEKIPGKIEAIGLSVTGPVDPQKGCVYLPGKIRHLAQHDTVSCLQKKWRVPVRADNDGRSACYAEWKIGAGKNQENLVVLTLGTGIGSGVVMEGRILTDRHFQRGTQCGHAVIDLHGPRCLTGPRGTGESIASITALVQEVKGAMARGLPILWNLKPSEAVDFETICKAYHEKDSIIREIVDAWIDRFSVVLLNTYYAYTPDLILLAGGPTKAAPLFLKKMEQHLNRWAFRYPPQFKIRLGIATLGEDAGWIGAALQVQE